MDSVQRTTSKSCLVNKMVDILIVGAGPAGLTAAIYARRAEKSVLVLEAKSYGGQIINTPEIENYPAAAHISGFDFAQKIYDQAKALGAEIRFEKAVELCDNGSYKTVITPKHEYEAKTVILATGSENRKLGLENEDRLLGRGVSYCATCDGAFFRKKTVAVVGGGNTALEDALYLSDLCEKVYLVHRRDEFRGAESAAKQLREKQNVEFLLNAQVTSLLENGKLYAIEVTGKDGKVQTIEVSGLFVAVGRIPENQNFSNIIDLDAAGYSTATENCKTNVPGIFVAGDNRQKEVRQLVTATADGAVAATAAITYLRENQ